MGDIENGLRKTNYVDFHDDRRALISCFDLNLQKTGFIDTNESADDICYCIPNAACGFLTPVVNVFLTPFLLAAHFLRIYLIPTVTIVWSRIATWLCCSLNICSVSYYDFDFPPNDRSVGLLNENEKKKKNDKPHTISNLDCWYTGVWHLMLVSVCRCFQPDQDYEWARATELIESKSTGDDGGAGAMKLFEGGIDANDICQGKVPNPNPNPIPIPNCSRAYGVMTASC